MRAPLFNTLLSLSFVALAGCAGDPLVGTWQSSQSAPGLTGSLQLILNADGTASTNVNYLTLSSMGQTLPCTGTGIVHSGYRWTATATTLSITGTSSACSGMITCGDASVSCAMFSTARTSEFETATYTLNNNTLTVTATTAGSSMTYAFTRRM